MSASMKQIPYFKREEKINKLIEQRDDINRQINAIQREKDADNAASFNKVMDSYNKEMNKRNQDIYMT